MTDSLPTDAQLRRLKPAPLTVGDAVQALFHGEAWAYATINAITDDGWAVIDWDDGETDDRWHALATLKRRQTGASALGA
jgi:hypothetical protein